MSEPCLEEIKTAISKYERIRLGAIRIIETHISRVFITPKFVYKQKKSVNFGFIDYTSLEKRRFFAEKELSLNRRACSGIYLNLQELRQKGKTFFIGFKGGTIRDVFVRMRLVADEQFLSNILNASRLGADGAEVDKLKVLKRVAGRIYLFHKSAKSSKRISGFGKTEIYRDNWNDNFLLIENLIGGFKGNIPKVDRENLSDILVHIKYFYEEFLRSDLFNEFTGLRIKQGFIKDLHGDLRMEHIAVTGKGNINRVCLMDCVEFNELFRNQDLYLDIAFLLMDFEFHGFFYESVKFFNYYRAYFNYAKLIKGFEKYEPFIIPFFKAYRAIVRTKIDLLSGRLESGLKHLKLASFYILSLKKPIVILNIGLSGSGKSSISDLLASFFYCKNIQSDKFRQDMFGFTDEIFKYGRMAGETVYNDMFEEGAGQFDKGRGIIFDATFLRKRYRQKFIDYFRKKDCNFVVIYSKICKDNEDVILTRLKNRQTAGVKADESKDYSEAGIAVYENQKKVLEEPELQEISAFQCSTAVFDISLITVDASLELSERFNYVAENIKNIITKKARVL